MSTSPGSNAARGKERPDRPHAPFAARLTSCLRCLPDFLIIGAQKCGTSTLHAQLATHPDIRPASRKELHFFDRHYWRGLSWYRALFPAAPPFGRNWLTFEATPSYLFHPHAAERLAKAQPRARLIVLLRDPVERAYSHYQMSLRQQVEPLSFEAAIDAEEERLTPELERMAADPTYYSGVVRKQSYLARGRYAEQLERWFQYFPREQVRVYTARELRQETRRLHQELFEFLGLRDVELPAVPDRNVARYEPMRPETRARLAEYFAPHNERLYRLLGRDFGWNSKK